MQFNPNTVIGNWNYERAKSLVIQVVLLPANGTKLIDPAYCKIGLNNITFTKAPPCTDIDFVTATTIYPGSAPDNIEAICGDQNLELNWTNSAVTATGVDWTLDGSILGALYSTKSVNIPSTLHKLSEGYHVIEASQGSHYCSVVFYAYEIGASSNAEVDLDYQVLEGGEIFLEHKDISNANASLNVTIVKKCNQFGPTCTGVVNSDVYTVPTANNTDPIDLNSINFTTGGNLEYEELSAQAALTNPTGKKYKVNQNVTNYTAKDFAFNFKAPQTGALKYLSFELDDKVVQYSYLDIEIEIRSVSATTPGNPLANSVIGTLNLDVNKLSEPGYLDAVGDPNNPINLTSGNYYWAVLKPDGFNDRISFKGDTYTQPASPNASSIYELKEFDINGQAWNTKGVIPHVKISTGCFCENSYVIEKTVTYSSPCSRGPFTNSFTYCEGRKASAEFTYSDVFNSSTNQVDVTFTVRNHDNALIQEYAWDFDKADGTDNYQKFTFMDVATYCSGGTCTYNTSYSDFNDPYVCLIADPKSNGCNTERFCERLDFSSSCNSLLPILLNDNLYFCPNTPISLDLETTSCEVGGSNSFTSDFGFEWYLDGEKINNLTSPSVFEHDGLPAGIYELELVRTFKETNCTKSQTVQLIINYPPESDFVYGVDLAATSYPIPVTFSLAYESMNSDFTYKWYIWNGTSWGSPVHTYTHNSATPTDISKFTQNLGEGNYQVKMIVEQSFPQCTVDPSKKCTFEIVKNICVNLVPDACCDDCN
ncbi:MAG: hypothetical protein JXQ87_17300 [Bacteroidia bacterium]